jgi:CRP-like cAMP-binding protein
MTSLTITKTANHLLSALKPSDFSQVARNLTRVRLRPKRVIYSHALLIASMRTSACNGLHRLQQRCARWLLTTLDRVDGDQFFITKEFLAQLLGTSRPMVSVTVAVFEKSGILKVEGRRITVADRKTAEGGLL